MSLTIRNRSAQTALAQMKAKLSQKQAKQAKSSAAQANGSALVKDPAKEAMKDTFKQQFGDLAKDKAKFHDTMKQVYGKGYDKAKAEQYRQQALKGDFSFMPPIKFVKGSELQHGNAAYNAKEGVIYVNENLKNNPQAAGKAVVEEMGHHLDAKLNKTDTKGDEGEMFRRILGGEKLSQKQINAIRNENDKRTITVDGKKVEVEFIFGKIKKAFKKVGNAIGGAAKKVAGGVKKAANFVNNKVIKPVGSAVSKAASWTYDKVLQPVGNAIKNTAVGLGNGIYQVGKGVVKGVEMFGRGIGEGIYGFGKNLVQGKVIDAFRSLVRGADKAFLQAPARVVHGVIDGAEEGLNGLTHLLGPLGKPLREHVVPRIADVGRQVFNTGFELVRDAARLAVEVPLNFAEDIGKAGMHAIKGEWGEAGKQFGLAFANAGGRIVGRIVDSGARTLQGIVDIGQTAIGLAPPSRKPTAEEIALLKKVYGDSIDYDTVRIKFGGPLNADINGRARVVGNYVYFPGSDKDQPLRDSSGNLTEYGETLIHEFAHVWQNQNGGGDYIHQALFSQVTQGDDAYDYQKGVDSGLSFKDLNPEQQGDYIAHELGPVLANRPAGQSAEAAIRAHFTDPAEEAYALNAYQYVQSGLGPAEGIWD